MARNHALACAARRRLCAALGVPPPCPETMLGSLASVPIPDGLREPLHLALFEKHRIEVPVMAWPAVPRRILRVSAQLYNEMADYERLAEALPALLPAVDGSHRAP
jgi:isopenicillin-N epimerase